MGTDHDWYDQTLYCLAAAADGLGAAADGLGLKAEAAGYVSELRSLNTERSQWMLRNLVRPARRSEIGGTIIA